MGKTRIHVVHAITAVLGIVFAAQLCIAGFDETPAGKAVIVINSGYRLTVDLEKGTLASLRSTFGIDHDMLIPGHVGLPLFKIEFMNDDGKFKTVTSSEANKVSVEKRRNTEGETINIKYQGIGQLPVDADATIACPFSSSLTYWSLEVKNRTTMWIGHVQFPVIEVPFDTPETGNYSHILSSFADGSIAGPIDPFIGTGAWGERVSDM